MREDAKKALSRIERKEAKKPTIMHVHNVFCTYQETATRSPPCRLEYRDRYAVFVNRHLYDISARIEPFVQPFRYPQGAGRLIPCGISGRGGELHPELLVFAEAPVARAHFLVWEPRQGFRLSLC